MSSGLSDTAPTQRASAKAKVNASWADRRRRSVLSKQQQQKQGIVPSRTSHESSHVHQRQAPISEEGERDLSRVSLCRLIRHAWDQAALEVGRTFQPKAPASKSSAASISTNVEKTRTFPSVLEILQATAVASQVETILSQEETLSADDGDTTAIMSILPATYDWDKAIQSSSTSRSRAFLLLDLAALIKAHWKWTRRLGGCMLSYAVHHNRSEKLLELWSRLNVKLACTHSVDVEAAVAAVQRATPSQSTSSDPSLLLTDCAARTRKPTGYIRRFLEAHRQDHTTRTPPCLAVDGRDEVYRILNTVQMLSKRSRNVAVSSVDFLLRLPRDRDSWMSLLQSTLDVTKTPSSRLVGVSFDLFPEEYSSMTEEREVEYLESLRSMIDEVCSTIISFDDHSADVRMDVTALPSEPSVVTASWLSNLAQSYPMVTVDASSMLMENAGALCTRIIGAKDDAEHDTRHYYIDDGCYGSLYSGHGTQIFRPLPLFAVSEQGSHQVVNSTVWGPTCDGLDKVCGNIPLPQLHVDEWLVFPNMGCGGGMGTAFNGFDPPDTVYCVLGYFRNKQ